MAITGTSGNDRLIGTSAAEAFDAGDGDDVLVSNGGFDSMVGGRGNDTYIVQGAVDIYEQRFDNFTGGGGSDVVLVDADRFVLSSGYGSAGLDVAVEAIAPLDASRAAGIALTGNIWAQTITGAGGNDTLDDGAVAEALDPRLYGIQDVLIGLGGNDTYVVRNAGTLVVEAAGGGTDTVFVAADVRSYALAANAEVEVLTALAGSRALDLVGNGTNQAITGNDGANVINGGGGIDTLIGLGGNDTYLVQAPGDRVVEANGGGTDIVYTAVSYNLGSNEVEALSVANQMTTGAINLIGNYVSQTIVGNYGDNILNGGSGADTLIGLFGNDTYVVGDSRIVIQEQAGQGTDTVVTSVSYTLAAGVSVEQMVAQDRNVATGLVLTGNEVAQVIGGTNAADTINGGAGSDTLIGFGGADTLAFTTTLGSTNVDTIADFSTSEGDRIGLGASIFAGIGTSLDANEFVVGTAATAATAQIIYNQSTGQLFYDADGTGAGAAMLFAVVNPGLTLTAASFVVT